MSNNPTIASREIELCDKIIGLVAKTAEADLDNPDMKRALCLSWALSAMQEINSRNLQLRTVVFAYILRDWHRKQAEKQEPAVKITE